MGRVALPMRSRCIENEALPSVPTALDEPHENDDDRDDEEDMNESSHGVRRNQTQKPEDDENDRDGFEHNLKRKAVLT
jgi:hypothetical protein